MALKIRLRQQGRKNRRVFRLVVTDCYKPRDGKYLESVGWYHPIETAEERQLLVKADRVQHWLDLGAQLSEKAEQLVARAAPELIKAQKEKLRARDAKLTAKRKERRRAAAKK